MLEEAAALPALRATDQLPPADGELVGPRPPEAECGRPIRPAPDERRKLGRNAEPGEPGGQALAEHAVGLEHVVGARKIPGPSHHAVGDFALRRLVKNGAAAGRPPHEPDAQRGAARAVHGVIERLGVAERYGGGLPAVEPHRGPARPSDPAAEERLVQRHVRRPVEGLRDEEAPGQP